MELLMSGDGASRRYKISFAYFFVAAFMETVIDK